MRRLAGIIAALALGAGVSAQERAIPPLDVPMSFSGTYGELRHDHFHSGVDWRVGGRVGDPVRAIKRGYISRVSVSPWGYGNGMYITHPDGTTSVYGHLQCFCDAVAARVEEAQFENESFSVDLRFGPEVFPVQQGDTVARVGNTGSSAGPHLHMEIRDTESGVTLNYLSRGVYTPLDRTPPRFHRVCFYGLDTQPVPQSWRVYNLVQPTQVRDTLVLPPRSYVGIDATDGQEGTPGKLAVEEYRVSLDDTLLFAFKVGEIPADRGRYIRSLIEYGESRRGGRDLVKTRVDPNNLLADRITCRDGGLIVLDDDAVHQVRLEAFDEHGNRAVTRYRIRRDTTLSPPPRDTSLRRAAWLWYTQNMVSDGTMTYFLPAGALYNHINFSWKRIAGPDPARGILSDIWQIGDPDTPQHLPGELEIAADAPEGLEDKVYLARYGETFSYAGPTVRFGTYCMALDTTPPAIRFLGTKGNIVSGSTIRIRVRDDAAGLESVRVEIDGKFYPAMLRRDVVSLELKENRVPRGNHTLAITVTDLCGNEAYDSRTFSY